MDPAALYALLSQATRLIGLDTAVPGAFAVRRFTGTEGVNTPFRFEIDALSTQADIDLAALVGQPATLRLATADGGTRRWHGYLSRADLLGSDGGLAHYRLVMESWLAFLALRRCTRIVPDQDARGVLERIFADHPEARYRFDVGTALRTRAITTQYRETDLDFALRLLSEEGLSYRFEHDPSDEGAHTLVIFDAQTALPEGAPAGVRVARIDATESTDALSRFGERLAVAPDALTAASWRPDQVLSLAGSAQADALANAPPLPGLDVFEADRAARFDAPGQADAFARHQLDALRLHAHTFNGEGAVRTLEAGKRYTLTEHPGLSDLAGTVFVPLQLEHEVTNNLPGLAEDSQRRAAAGLLDGGSYRGRFTAVPADTPIAPRHRDRPRAPGLQSAIVTGLPDAALTGNREHQVRVQFSWQRGAAPLAGGLADPEHAPGDHTSGTWVRIAEQAAGAHHGQAFLPRVGSEVLVGFAHGDIDQPVIVGRLYNGRHAPPFAAGEGAETNHPGTLSGLQTRGLDGQHASHWVLDDAPGQLRQSLGTSLADSRLQLGYLVDQQGASRSSFLGEGFALSTQGWASLRAGQGLLLSSTARPQGQGTQLGSPEALGQLKAALATTTRLDQAARGARAGALAPDPLQTLQQTIDPAQDGKHPATVNGQAATQPTASGREGGDPVERFAQPLILAESPQDLALTTPRSATAFAGQALHLTAQHDAHFAAGATFAAAGGGPVRLYAAQGGAKAIAQHGPVSLQAHDGPLEILADQSVTVTSTTDRLDVLAKDAIVLQAGQTRITLQGADITFECPGSFVVKAASHEFLGPDSQPPSLPPLPEGDLPTDTLYLDHRYHDDEGLGGAKYFVTLPDGHSTRQGALDSAGKAEIPGLPAAGLQVSFSPAAKSFERKDQTPTPGYMPKPSEAALAALVDKYAGTSSTGGTQDADITADPRDEDA